MSANQKRRGLLKRRAPSPDWSEFQADSGFTVLAAARMLRLAGFGRSEAATRAAASRSSASLARRNARKRLVLAASICRRSVLFRGLDFALLVLDRMFLSTLSLSGAQNPDYSGSFIFVILSCCRARWS